MTYFDDFEYFVTFSFIMDSEKMFRARADTVDLVEIIPHDPKLDLSWIHLLDLEWPAGPRPLNFGCLTVTI